MKTVTWRVVTGYQPSPLWANSAGQLDIFSVPQEMEVISLHCTDLSLSPLQPRGLTLQIVYNIIIAVSLQNRVNIPF